ncbi:SLC26/SulP family anion transporter [Aspergillus clavatus NRRL 1]|uniref:Sulfate transporter, putative n=1 Tax=Aspergillus clavatus (strain ATCC 1007 / CBS 513.65 / DSM 816 / NCTC 3887 / NRRL 1 / QM 1276 / 107) TaxID=344612 RepID=A1CRG1_ASPCL|nr:sulfate transporter, putative [Aspergillus clavatus NRRL 1]EAW08232.1 sulfate transporter, putative [Aspergillus clavatus NRRL 1]
MGSDFTTKVGHGLAKGLGITLPYRDPLGANADPVTRGESMFSVGTVETYSYVEPEPTSADWLKELCPTWRDVGNYFYRLFPFLTWITRYNMQWFIGDLVAGVTVGAVVVPQGMAYAKLAALPVEFGLYSSFMGVLIYWFFATSKDITIGPVAVMSTLVGTIVLKAQKEIPDVPAHIIASAMAIICGGIVCAMGLLRLGFIVDFIPLPAISAFMTGSALNICSGQVKDLLGETADFSTRDATYEIIINTLKNLPSAKVDAAMGLTALAMLYIIRSACNYGAKKYPQRAKTFFFLSTLRTVFVILFYTMISAAVNIHRRKNPAFKLLGSVPRGFQHAAVPVVNARILKTFASELPAAVIVLLIEHIAISKSFGRVNNYTIDPSQELVAIGVSNLLGPFLGGYPATGSFSRTAIKSKAGVRTPLAGCITAVVVLLAIYALPAMFFYIPKSSLSGVIIHAVGDLITPPNVVYQFWRVSPLDAIIFFVGVIVTVFTSIEIGIYCTVCISVAVLLFRVAKARGQFLGRVTIHSVVGDHLVQGDGKYGSGNGYTPADDQGRFHRSIFLPINHTDGSNPDVEVQQPYPGIFIYRFSEGFNYPNCNHYTDYLVRTIFQQTRRTNPFSYTNLGDRPWNNPGPRRGKEEPDRSHLPTLRAVILDFSSVNNVDVTAVQNLIDVRNQLDLYAAPQPVQWHFAHVNNRWSKRALAAAGFGYPTPTSKDGFHRWKPIFSVAEIEGKSSAAALAELVNNEQVHRAEHKIDDIEEGLKSNSHATERETHGIETSSDGSSHQEDKLQRDLTDSEAYRNRRKVALVQGLNRPFFHIDLTSALESALANSAQDLHVDPAEVSATTDA